MAKVSLSIKSLNSTDFKEDKVQKLELEDVFKEQMKLTQLSKSKFVNFSILMQLYYILFIFF